MPNGRCRLHGGKSTGPRTAEGLARLARAHTTHGNSTAAARADRRHVRTVITHNYVLAAAMQFSAWLPADLRARLALGADELAAPPYPSHRTDPPTLPNIQPDTSHPVPVQPAGRSAQARDAHGCFAAKPSPVPRGTKAERAAARAERAMLAPWRAGIKRARLIRRLLTLQARNARDMQPAQHVPRSLSLFTPPSIPRPAPLAAPSAADPATATRQAVLTPSGSVGPSNGVPRLPAVHFALACRNPIHRETTPHPASRGENPVKTLMQRGTEALPAASAGACGEAAVKTPMQRGTVAGPAGRAAATSEASGAQTMHLLPPPAHPKNVPPVPTTVPTDEAADKTPMQRGTGPSTKNPFRGALLAGTACDDPAARRLAAQVERAGGWPVLIAIDAANQAGIDWRPAIAAVQRRLAGDKAHARTSVLDDPSPAWHASPARRADTSDNA